MKLDFSQFQDPYVVRKGGMHALDDDRDFSFFRFGDDDGPDNAGPVELIGQSPESFRYLRYKCHFDAPQKRAV